ncbi:hypothetical protein V8E36_003762 [Tilletia maclaganii]
MGKPKPRARAQAQARAAPIRASAAPPTPTERAFTHTLEGPILVLLFASKPAQLDALARMETYYEGNGADARSYLSVERARGMGVCSNYTAFNFTVQAVRDWLGLMWAALERRRGGAAALEGSTAEVGGAAADGGGERSAAPELKSWWEEETCAQERHLLRLLGQLGCLDALPFGPCPGQLEARTPEGPQQSEGPGTSADPSVATSGSGPAPRIPPTYVISALASQVHDLTHERLHALFHLSPTYAATSTALYNTLSPKIRTAIEWDLSARGYRAAIFADEWQAYTSENPGEFGGKARAECEALRGELWKAQAQARKELGLS